MFRMLYVAVSVKEIVKMSVSVSARGGGLIVDVARP